MMGEEGWSEEWRRMASVRGELSYVVASVAQRVLVVHSGARMLAFAGLQNPTYGFVRSSRINTVLHYQPPPPSSDCIMATA